MKMDVKRAYLWICVGCLLVSQTAPARVEDTCPYSKSQVFRSALRFLRVDQGVSISERDEESGYLLFEYPVEKTHTTPGSLEIIEREGGVKIILSIAKLPEYHERHFVAKLLDKLRADYGDPPQVVKKKPKPEEDKKDESEEEPEEPDGEPEEKPKKPKKAKS